MTLWIRKIWTGFKPGTPERKANTITAELKRILTIAGYLPARTAPQRSR